MVLPCLQNRDVRVLQGSLTRHGDSATQVTDLRRKSCRTANDCASAQQAERRLAVADGPVERPRAGLIERQPVYFDHLGALVCLVRRREVPGEEQVQTLAEYPR